MSLSPLLIIIKNNTSRLTHFSLVFLTLIRVVMLSKKRNPKVLFCFLFCFSFLRKNCPSGVDVLNLCSSDYRFYELNATSQFAHPEKYQPRFFKFVICNPC